MKTEGWVYLLINPSMNGLIKIGKTTRDPEDRVQELSGVTGVPTPFMLVYKSFFQNCHEAEVFVHTVLEQKNYRVADNREFFTAPVDVGINTIIEAHNYLTTNTSPTTNNLPEPGISNDNLCENLMQAGDTSYYGLGETIQDTSQAMNHYMQAYKLGSPEACLAIGTIYAKDSGFKNERKAIDYYNEGIRRGLYECCAELGLIYAEQGHIENAVKCWTQFFNSDYYYKYEREQGMYEAKYLRCVRHGRMPLIHKDILFERYDLIESFILRSVEHFKTIGEDGSLAYSELDFASFVLKGEFASGKRHRGIVKKILQDDQYVVDDEKKNFWIFNPVEVIDNSNICIGCELEYNLVKFKEQSFMPHVCNIVKV